MNRITNYRKTIKAWYINFYGDRIYLKSSYEIRYAKYLDFLAKFGHLKRWRYEPDIFWFDGIKRGINNYTPDFKTEHNDGSIEYIEVKGYMDSESKTKIKRMRIYYPNIKLTIKDKTYFTKVLKIKL